MRQRGLLLFALVLGCSTCAGEGETRKARDVGVLNAVIDSLFDAAVEPDAPGVVAFVGYDGEVLHARGYGLADVAARVENSPTTNIRIASVSKQFTAMAILCLVDDGLLSLDRSVGDVLGEPYFADVTIEHLLTHTSGLPDNEAVWKETWDTSRVATNQDLVDWFVEERPEFLFEPGTGWEYSQAGYNVLATVVEVVTGETLADFVTRRVLAPAGVETATFFSLARPAEVPERAATYTVEDGEYTIADGHYLNGLVGGDGMFMNALDYLRWDQALRDETIVSPELHRLALGPRTQISDEFNAMFERAFPGLPVSPSAYGYGWFVTMTPGRTFAWHQGGWYGVQAVVIHELDRPLTMGMFGNTDEIPLRLMTDLFELVDGYVEGGGS